VTRIGIMQGRLVPPEQERLQSFPRSRWRDEFGYAAEVPVSYIEWICDGYGADVNPLMDDDRLSSVQAAVASTGIAVRSVCADYLMEKPLVHFPESREFLRRLLVRCRNLGVKRIVLPFVDNSALRPQDLDPVIHLLADVANDARNAAIEIHLETSLPPAQFAAMLRQLPADVVKVNYDSGNSASLGYKPVEEFAAIGDRIGSVHIKDRILGGGTVPLGTGDVDFRSLFECLRKVQYSGDFTLQVARSEPGDEIAWAKRNLEFVTRRWDGGISGT
jgi:L-ribulose-5-phosphate 3-epimerase